MMSRPGSIDEYRICPICKDDMTHRLPRMLPCVHSYCTECLDGLVKHSKFKKTHTIECPQCRKTVKLPSEGATALPLNFLLGPSKNETEKEVRKCMMCKENLDAIVRCVVCFKDLCRDCRTKHNEIQAFQSHSLRSITSDVCPEHTETIQYICDFCDKELCTSCTFSDDHKDHRRDIVTIEESSNKLKEAICDKAKDMQKHLKNKMLHLKHVRETIISARQEINVHAKVLHQEIDKAAHLLISELDDRRSNADKLTESVQNNLFKMQKTEAVCKEERKDSDFYSALKSLDISTEFNAEAGRKFCGTAISVPSFRPNKKDTGFIGNLAFASENLEIYPTPRYEEDPYSLNSISVCSDTIYELFLSRGREKEGISTEVADNEAYVELTKKKPEVKPKPITKYPRQEEHENTDTPGRSNSMVSESQRPKSLDELQSSGASVLSQRPRGRPTSDTAPVSTGFPAGAPRRSTSKRESIVYDDTPTHS